MIEFGNTMSPVVPAITSRFAAREHPADEELRTYTRRFCESVFYAVADDKYDATAGGYLEVGGRFVSLLYPGGARDRVRAATHLMLAWVLVDDRIDASLDPAHIETILGKLTDAVWLTSPADEPEYGIIAEFLARGDWQPDTRRRCRSGLQRYIDATRTLRTIEIEKRPFTLDQYMSVRPDNLGWDILLYLPAYVSPDLAAEYCAAERTDTYRALYRDTGTCVGIALDLGLVDAGRHNHTAWTNIDAIIQRSAMEDMNHQQAIDSTVDLFHRLEDRIEADLTALAAQFPAVATALRDVYTGSIAWVHELRGRRYSGVDTAGRTPSAAPGPAAARRHR
ncbi:hypothetical protein [Nocardia blacklockiae]|uniref:hypothetical protein n=1 Tax=Nocardia blacklockiae TaxID=480036 RepID=UPI00189638C4|nr:hypothetical protein [Nocardia blacklockiae]MBF6176589.1 hypothetical protein [Nocardia blacklockiae]